MTDGTITRPAGAVSAWRLRRGQWFRTVEYPSPLWSAYDRRGSLKPVDPYRGLISGVVVAALPRYIHFYGPTVDN